MTNPVPYIPVATTVVALCFAGALLQRWGSRRTGPHLLWWALGALTYALGTISESATTLLGWHEPLFRMWYISGALLGGAPLAQGTVYLLLARRTANRLAALLIATIVVASVLVLLSPIDYAAVEPHRLTGRVLQWHAARLFSPFINTYAFVFLVGGAALSARRYRRESASHHRFVGNVLIAAGALLPGVGGTFTRFGHTEVLYVTEFIGLVLITIGYRFATTASPGVSYAGIPAAASA